MFKHILIFSATIIALSLLFSNKIRGSSLWRATVTPLASIIGSGFLVIAPLLALTTGQYAIIAIVALVVLGYLCGEVMRFNIMYFEPILSNENKNRIVHLEHMARLVLGFAYVTSITFYLKLLAAFILKGLHSESDLYANILTTSLLLFIAIMGKLRGLDFLEDLEEYSVNIKLSIIAGLIAGLLYFNIDLIHTAEWKIQIPPKTIDLNSLRTLMGALIVVQGFETSRFLSTKYSAKERVQTMRWAQILSGMIYFVFVALIMTVFSSTPHVSDTEIIDLSGHVDSTLPHLLILAAVMSQFSAAVADTVGSGGLLHEIFKPRLSLHNSYLLIGLLAVLLSWSTNVFEVVSIASRAFAFYYSLQSIIATRIAYQKKLWWKFALFAILSIILLGISIFATPAEA